MGSCEFSAKRNPQSLQDNFPVAPVTKVFLELQTGQSILIVFLIFSGYATLDEL